MKFKCEERLLKSEDCEAETPWYPTPKMIWKIGSNFVHTLMVIYSSTLPTGRKP